MDVLELMCTLEKNPGLFRWLLSSSSELLSADVNLCVPGLKWPTLIGGAWPRA